MSSQNRAPQQSVSVVHESPRLPHVGAGSVPVSELHALLWHVSPLQQSPSTSQNVPSSPHDVAVGSPASSPVASAEAHALFTHTSAPQQSGSVSQKSPVCPHAGVVVVPPPASSPDEDAVVPHVPLLQSRAPQQSRSVTQSDPCAAQAAAHAPFSSQ
jgi:hypothetical protein